MRTNALKAKLGAGQRVVGALLTINSADLVELFGHLGYDFVFLDGQHGGLSVETARELVRAAELTGMTPLIRVPRNDPAVILDYLEIGAGGIIVPDVASRADAEAAVRAVKYPPDEQGVEADVPPGWGTPMREDATAATGMEMVRLSTPLKRSPTCWVITM